MRSGTSRRSATRWRTSSGLPADVLSNSLNPDSLIPTSRGAGHMSTQPRVVVTGLGASTPVGGDAASTWQGLLSGRSGVSVIEEPWADELPVRIAAQVAVDPRDVLERVEARKLDRTEQLALIAAREAWADAGAPDVDKERLGVVVATGIGGAQTPLSPWDTPPGKGPRSGSPPTPPLLMPHGPAPARRLRFSPPPRV